MPVYHCCVPECTSSTRKLQDLDKHPHMKDVTFYSLPKKSEQRRRNQWIRLIRRGKSWVPNKYTRICSCHFEPGSNTPTLFPYNNFKKSSYTRKTSNSIQMPDDISDEEETSTESNSDIPLHHYEEDNIPYVAEEYEINTSHDRSEGVKHVKKVECITNPPFLDHVYAAGTSPGSTDVNVQDTAVQTDMTMNDINIMSDQIHQLQAKLDDKTTLLRECFIETVTKNDENVKLYTGLPSLAMLLGIFNILAAKCSALKYWSGPPSAQEKNYQRNRHGKPGPSRKLSFYQEFILSLVRLRLGLFEFCIADLFGVSKSRVSQIFITWITFMSNTFGNFLRWPSQRQVKKYMPLSFRKQYPNTRAIIDCTEFFLQRPRSPTAQAATYSTYKSKNTAKCLLAISPAGNFTFVSKLYGGNVSDRFITEDSGFLNFVEEGDDIMADRGFTIRDLLTDKKATLNIPPFTRKCPWGKKKRLNVNEIKQTRKIAKLRIHVERAIQRLKLFRLIGNVIPWSLKPVINQMIKVSAFLCNLMPTLVRK
nr:uncharacterized protein LOC105330058 [Crassostrea gigas]